MTREQCREIRIAALENLKTDIENDRKRPNLQPAMQNELEQGYQAILQMQAERERGGFWMPENEQRYLEYVKK